VIEPAQPLSGLRVVTVRYWGSRLEPDRDCALKAYAASDVYRHAQVDFDVVEPHLADDQRTGEEDVDLGLLGGAIADAVAPARREGKAVLMVGGNCQHTTGVVGGLQDAHGPGARIGLVWFDAHGDFNTPRTTLTGSLGGMPVAVCAGLAYPRWRELSHVAAPLPTDRILFVGVRNLDPPEERLIRATDSIIAAPAPGFPGVDLENAVTHLAERCDALYLHIDSDVLDESLVPNHGTREPNGPNMAQVQTAMDAVMATGKVVAFAVVSVYCQGEGSEVAIASGIELVRNGLESWRRHGIPSISTRI
jgi:arginase